MFQSAYTSLLSCTTQTMRSFNLMRPRPFAFGSQTVQALCNPSEVDPFTAAALAYTHPDTPTPPPFTDLVEVIKRIKVAHQHGGCIKKCDRLRTDDTRLPWDTKREYGGWGGHDYFDTESGADKTPIVFVHGNSRDACDWERHAEAFLEAGYTGDELWAITFERGAPTHSEMATQLDAFVNRIREYTNMPEVAVVAHSLGVTGVRYWLATCDRYDWVSTVVGIAGANHGSELATLCTQLGLDVGPLHVCSSIRHDYDHHETTPLAVINPTTPPPDIDYYTIRGADDELFRSNPESPILENATANVCLDTDHDGVRTHPKTMQFLLEWCQSGSSRGKTGDSAVQQCR